jgi:enoyl-CoA hydratase/carnithine racemase
MTGRNVTASQMQACDFVNEVFADEVLVQEIQALTEHIARNSPLAIWRMKEIANPMMLAVMHPTQHKQVEFRKHMRSWDFQEGDF